MVFKRRDPRPLHRVLTEVFWPRGGWTRAAYYITHRIRRLPDTPHRIARGVLAGVLTSFTPLFGFHFLTAAAIAWVIRGNILAALIATFFGNPLTFPVIAYVAMWLGKWMLGGQYSVEHQDTLLEAFMAAGYDIQHNAVAIFTDDPTRWGGLARFFPDVFLPYLVGGLIPGLIAGLICHRLTLPLILAYQNRRRTRLKERFEKLKARLAQKAEDAEARPASEGTAPLHRKSPETPPL
ncbi:DUF2062 domain-containing protein [Phaeovulum vinaykumarii]|uniref:DUF2062 domain-containing protein n=1 Tax=Phaeovulum vinaykumarii TaxID=407234 RepID=A0A1N7KDS4_9RHOB|nr:DUF2062 domain-containing protein [Phaeovulum vinaykumarii]SIS59712.1 hypothetical protein SAMN05421795_101853 [Phaeovulum vinaykumarii]SOB94201.1 hypothetical protein SAMN05878426_101849 [Phaeovulum vinaykumarii]